MPHTDLSNPVNRIGSALDRSSVQVTVDHEVLNYVNNFQKKDCDNSGKRFIFAGMPRKTKKINLTESLDGRSFLRGSENYNRQGFLILYPAHTPV